MGIALGNLRRQEAVRLMARPTTIRIFLPDGRPDGLRVVEKALFTGKGLDFARADWLEVRKRSDFDRPGVYVLTGPDEAGGSAVYIGEADQLRSRLNNHYASVDFWTRATAFVSKDENLNKADVRYLESRLINLAGQAKRSTLKNGTAPDRPFLSEAEQAEAEGFLDEMLPIYPLLGVTAFEQAKIEPSGTPTRRLHLEGKGISAFGAETAQGFIVEAGATAVIVEVPSLYEQPRAIRSKLKDEGLLVQQGAHLRLTQAYVFDSPSGAAAVLLARPANGRTEWKDSSGRTLKQIQEEAAKTSLKDGTEPL